MMAETDIAPCLHFRISRGILGVRMNPIILDYEEGLILFLLPNSCKGFKGDVLTPRIAAPEPEQRFVEDDEDADLPIRK